MIKAQRHQLISEYVRENRVATVEGLSKLLGVSESTIRRDLQNLDSQDIVRRAHGGAVSIERASPEPPVIQRTIEHAEEKKKIGQAAADLVGAHETVFLGSGTTTMEVARNLVDLYDLTVITNALNVAFLLAGYENITVVLTGGILRHSELSLIGHFVENVLNELHADKVIMGIRGLSVREGLTNDYVQETMTDRSIVSAAPEVILVADHSKFGKISTAFVAPIQRINTLVTDAATPSSKVNEILELGIEVIIA